MEMEQFSASWLAEVPAKAQLDRANYYYYSQYFCF